MLVRFAKWVSVAGLLACCGAVYGQQDIRPQPGGPRLYCFDADGQSIRKEPSGPRVLFCDPDGKTIRKEPSGPRILFVDGDDVREDPNGVRLGFLDGRNIRRSPGGPILFDYKHPDLCPTANANREFFVDGKELTRQQLVAVLYLLKPKMFELSKDEMEKLKKEMKENGEAEEKRLAADRAVGKFDILTAYNAVASSGQVLVAPKKGDVYHLEFKHKGGPEWVGVGVQVAAQDMDRWLWLAFGPPKTVGLGVFEIKGGTLEGKWYNGYSDKEPKNTGTETLKGPESLDGEYTISNAKTPHDGTEYTGKVTIKPLDLVFDEYKPYTLVYDFGGGKKMEAVGLRSKDGKTLYVASGVGEAFNIACFKLGTNGEMIGDFLNNKKDKGYYSCSKVVE